MRLGLVRTQAKARGGEGSTTVFPKLGWSDLAVPGLLALALARAVLALDALALDALALAALAPAALALAVLAHQHCCGWRCCSWRGGEGWLSAGGAAELSPDSCGDEGGGDDGDNGDDDVDLGFP